MRRKRTQHGGTTREVRVVREEGSESLTVRISRAGHAALRALAEEAGESMTEVLDQAIELYRRQRFLSGLNADFAALQQDKTTWEEELAEREAWDSTLTDGLEG
ncbi:MAG TPA: toxin-antitoxin system protein [Isosphaeraceae bacterium]|nr:toxin-antitoxin system protein [Isosphaeraceae bacterium]